jgi:tRNA threonylcarbamoyladenosine biosynthesis protein TsaE
MNTREITIGSIEELPQVGEMLREASQSCTIWALYGEMGAGKTTLIKEVCKQMGVKDTVTSPTFALVNEYQIPAKGPIYHFDFYRIRDLREAFDMGYEEYFYSGNLCFIEWPEKIEELLPDYLGIVRITRHEDNSRTILLQIPPEAS